MTLEEGKELVNKIISELKYRFLVNLPHFEIKIVTKDGITKELF